MCVNFKATVPDISNLDQCLYKKNSLILAHPTYIEARFCILCIKFLICAAVSVILNAASAGFGVATGPVLIDETRCAGTESRLIYCRHNGIGTHNCAHSQDVGLRCRVRKLYVTGDLHPEVQNIHVPSTLVYMYHKAINICWCIFLQFWLEQGFDFVICTQKWYTVNKV